MARPLPGGEGRPAVPLRQAAHRSAAGWSPRYPRRL